MAIHQGLWLSGNDHPQAVWREGLFSVHALPGHPETVDALQRRGRFGDGTQLARAGRIAAALRHRFTEKPLPSQTCEGPGNSLLRPDQPECRVGCGGHSRCRHHLQGPLAGQRGAGHAGDLGKTLYHPRTDLDIAGSCHPPAGPRRVAWRQTGPRNYLSAGSHGHAGRQHRPAPHAAERRFPERPQLGQGCVHAA